MHRQWENCLKVWAQRVVICGTGLVTGQRLAVPLGTLLGPISFNTVVNYLAKGAEYTLSKPADPQNWEEWLIQPRRTSSRITMGWRNQLTGTSKFNRKCKFLHQRMLGPTPLESSLTLTGILWQTFYLCKVTDTMSASILGLHCQKLLLLIHVNYLFLTVPNNKKQNKSNISHCKSQRHGSI